ncbi:unnamed protein product, partial [Durusdinium trenchii]
RIPGTNSHGHSCLLHGCHGCATMPCRCRRSQISCLEPWIWTGRVLGAAACKGLKAARGSSFALIVESVKLMPVTRALETFGAGSILSSLSDPLEALVASKLLRKRVEVLCGTKLLDYLNQLSLDSLKSFDAVWLGYDGGRAMTSASLHGCSEWSHLNALLSLRLLSENALLA